MKRNSYQQGQVAEQLALRYLEQQGLRLVKKNFHSQRGEIDIIMRQDDTLVFVEVRQRSRRHYGSALESITPKKQQRIIQTAHYYLQQHPQQQNDPCRFDVVVIEPQSGEEKIQWIKNAFQA